MEESPYLRHFRLILRLGTAIDVTSGTVHVTPLLFAIACWLAVVTSNIVALVTKDGDTPVRAVHEVVIFLCSTVMIMFLLLHRKDITVLVESLLKPFDAAVAGGEAGPVRAYHRWANRFGTMYIFYHFLFLSCLTMALGPLLTLPLRPPSTTACRLPLPVGHLPCQPPTAPHHYAAAYVLSACAICTAGLCHAACHLLMIFACLRMKTELQLLADFIMCLGESKFNSTESEDEADHQYLVQAIKRHVQVIRFSRLFNRCFRSPLLILFESCNVIIAFLLFQIVDWSSRQASELWTVFFLMCGCLIVPGVFNVAGQTVINESESVRWALYSCAWHGRPRRFATTLRPALAVLAARPVTLTVGGLYPLSHHSYANMMKAVYSYINLLLTMLRNK